MSILEDQLPVNEGSNLLQFGFLLVTEKGLGVSHVEDKHLGQPDDSWLFPIVVAQRTIPQPQLLQRTEAGT